ncbi:MAG TPA: hypothetical protein VGN77_03295, partial [Steroidobacteraceae bacterium]|nr:hypothetical protein [Steroidobacteraceae bacterium]
TGTEDTGTRRLAIHTFRAAARCRFPNARKHLTSLETFGRTLSNKTFILQSNSRSILVLVQ